MNEPLPAAPKPSITESPWYWVYLFATAGLVALVLMGPKFRSRQTQIENKYQGRQRAVRQASGQAADTPLSSEEDTLIDLRPLYAILIVILAAAGGALWLRRRRLASALRQGPSP